MMSSALQQAAELLDRLFGDLARGQHQPNRRAAFLRASSPNRQSTPPLWHHPLPALRASWRFARTRRSGVPPSSGGETCCRPSCPVRSYRSAFVFSCYWLNWLIRATLPDGFLEGRQSRRSMCAKMHAQRSPIAPGRDHQSSARRSTDALQRIHGRPSFRVARS